MSALERLTRDVGRFPTISNVAARLIRRLEDPECDLGAVAELVSRDGVLAGRIVKLARSPCFGGGMGMEGESIHHAISRLGIAQTRSTVLTVSIMSVLPALPPPLTLSSFWSLGLGTALSARYLALDLLCPRPEDAYLAGLVHMLGEAYLAIHFERRYVRAVRRALERQETIEIVLEDEFGFGHPAVGGAVLRAWSFSDEVVYAVEHHLDAPTTSDLTSLGSLVFVADRVCRDLKLGPEDRCPEGRPWIEQVPDDLVDRIQRLGYPDLSYYLLDQREFLAAVEKTVVGTFERRG